MPLWPSSNNPLFCCCLTWKVFLNFPPLPPQALRCVCMRCVKRRCLLYDQPNPYSFHAVTVTLLQICWRNQVGGGGGWFGKRSLLSAHKYLDVISFDGGKKTRREKKVFNTRTFQIYPPPSPDLWLWFIKKDPISMKILITMKMETRKVVIHAQRDWKRFQGNLGLLWSGVKSHPTLNGLIWMGFTLPFGICPKQKCQTKEQVNNQYTTRPFISFFFQIPIN